MADTKTEVVNTETVFLGKEHVRFLDDLVDKLRQESGYKTTKSQIIRLLIEGSMRQTLDLKNITNEDELRMALAEPPAGEPTRIKKR